MPCTVEAILWCIAHACHPFHSSMPHNDLLEGAIVMEEFCKVYTCGHDLTYIHVHIVQAIYYYVCIGGNMLPNPATIQEVSCVLFAKHSTALLTLPPCDPPSPITPPT